MTTTVQCTIPDGLTSAETAEVFGVTTATVSRWVQSGFLPVLHRGSRGRSTHVFDPEVVRDLAEKRAAAVDLLAGRVRP